MNNLGLVSIGITTFNRKDMLQQAIQSALNQSYRNIEVIVSDNDSSDETNSMTNQYLADPRFKYFKQPHNIGGFANVNFCLAKSTGDYWLWLADDDWLESEAIERLIKGFTMPDVVMATCATRIIDGEGEQLRTVIPKLGGAVSDTKFLKARFKYQVGYSSAELFRTSIVRMCGGYKMFHHLDLIMDIEVARHGRVYVENTILCNYRLHGGNAVTNRELALSLGLPSLVEVFKTLAAAGYSGEFVRFAKRRTLLQLLRMSSGYAALGYKEAKPQIAAVLYQLGYTSWFWKLLLDGLTSKPMQTIWKAAKYVKTRIGKS
jgi:glycosyltransferase involved in cell wall biosynthesis